MKLLRVLIVAGALLAGAPAQAAPPPSPLDAVAGDYAELMLSGALAFNLKIEVDPSLEPRFAAARAAGRDKARIAAEARALMARLDALPPETDSLAERRRRLLRARLSSLELNLRPADAPRLDVVEDVRRRYGFDPEFRPLSDFDPAVSRLEQAMPGEGSLGERIARMRSAAAVAPDRVEAVFKAALAECRRRSARRLALGDETVEVQIVDEDLTPAEALYQGGGRTIVRVSRRIPTDADRLLVHACHEGYPGHHAHFLAMDRTLFRQRGWVEYGVGIDSEPMFPVAEAVAEYGVGLTFPVEERIAFLRDVLLPLAGRRMEDEAAWRAYLTARPELLGSSATIAGDLLAGNIDAARAAQLLERYRLQTPQAAAQTARMISAFGSMVIASDLGWAAMEDVMRGRSEKEQWALLARLQHEPMLLADLKALRGTREAAAVP